MVGVQQDKVAVKHVEHPSLWLLLNKCSTAVQHTTPLFNNINSLLVGRIDSMIGPNTRTYCFFARPHYIYHTQYFGLLPIADSTIPGVPWLVRESRRKTGMVPFHVHYTHQRYLCRADTMQFHALWNHQLCSHILKLEAQFLSSASWSICFMKLKH